MKKWTFNPNVALKAGQVAYDKVMGGRYMNGVSNYEGRLIDDEEVAKYVKKHLRFIDRFDLRRVVECSILSQLILFGVIEAPKGDKWKFYKHFRVE